MIRVLDSAQDGFLSELDQLLEWDTREDIGIEQTARSVLEEIRLHGDEAVLRYTAQFDELAADSVAALKVTRAQMQDALDKIDQTTRIALQNAAQRIRRYHEHQLEDSWSFEDELGNRLGQEIRPLERVGVYVPGGQASYPSSVLMTLIPARVAGVDELIVTVPTPRGEVNQTVLAALAIAEAEHVFTIGGAQAIGALAFGTETIPRVDKIVGPGGAYVAAAKRLVFGVVGIDLIAGPSEILVIADGSVDVEWSVLDLFSQAEHDAAAQAILITPDQKTLERVREYIDARLPGMQRQDTIRASLSDRGILIKCRDTDEAVALANRIAPEHLELHVQDAEALVPAIRNAGAIFCGPHAGETLGDYVAGPSHVLPTFGTARFASPLGVYDFQKRSSVIRISEQGAAVLADVAVPLATSEGLQAHALAAAARAQQKKVSD